MKKSVNLYFNNNLDSKDKIRAIKEIGYDEFYTGLYDKNETITPEKQIEFAKELGLDCTMIHCSYYEPELDNFWLENEIGDKIENSYLMQIKRCENLTKNFVVHLNWSLNSVVSETGLKRIERLLEQCEKSNINLCVENLFSEKEIPYIFSKLNNKFLKICFDTGHKNFITKNFEVMKNFGQFVSVLHIHDNDGQTDQHKIIGTGSIDLKKLAIDLSMCDDITLSAEIKYHNESDYKKVLKENLEALKNLEKLIKNN